LEIIPFLFKNNDELIKYFDSFETGTHIYLFDLKTIHKNEIGYLQNINNNINSNYELLFDKKENDIYLNEEIGFNEELKKNIIDFSFKKYLNFLYLKHNKHTNIFLFGKKIELENPYYEIKLMSSSGIGMKKIANLNYTIENNDEKINSFNIEGIDYNGILFNEDFIDSISSNTDIGIEDIKEKDYLNGILLYKNNILICRLNQSFFGDISFFIKKIMNINNDLNKNNDDNIEFEFCNFNVNTKIFKKYGYIELPNVGYELMFNNMEIKDQALFGFLYNKIKILLQKIHKNKN